MKKRENKCTNSVETVDGERREADPKKDRICGENFGKVWFGEEKRSINKEKESGGVRGKPGAIGRKKKGQKAEK